MAEISQQPTNDQLDEQRIWAALKDVPDPELPAISVIDMGIVRRVEIDATRSHIRVEITPTFSGCPALLQPHQPPPHLSTLWLPTDCARKRLRPHALPRHRLLQPMSPTIRAV